MKYIILYDVAAINWCIKMHVIAARLYSSLLDNCMKMQQYHYTGKKIHKNL